MEIYCLYGVGIPTDQCKSIPFRVDGSAEGDNLGCLSGGVYLVDGDGSLPVVSSGFMCAKAWRGKTRFNPPGSPTYLREHRHRAPASTHVDIMGNVALIEDVLRVAAGASGLELGGDQIFSDIKRISERIDLRL
ncbi:hypothetical protein SAY87_025488 [Trapa incisa]|uniref:Uncharacterized protein n=1 Tax=Trapa incisa TaxID=236973 RepID=A0AAN7GFX6_9MYRT|nr:hypothetical protein SAY87_025488 [Trapa incisa]